MSQFDTDRFMVQHIDWDLPPAAFETQIGEMIHQFTAAGKVIPLPVALHPGADFKDLLFVLLAKIDCSGCDAPCCRDLKAGQGEIAMEPLEYEHLKETYPHLMSNVRLDKDHIIAPCPLLKDGRCQVYQDRPLVCWLYPFQFGAWAGPDDHTPPEQPNCAVSSACPSARKLAKAVYINAYKYRRCMKVLGRM